MPVFLAMLGIYCEANEIYCKANEIYDSNVDCNLQKKQKFIVSFPSINKYMSICFFVIIEKWRK